MKRRYRVSNEGALGTLPIEIRKAPTESGVYTITQYHVDVDGVTAGMYDSDTNVLQLEANLFGPWSTKSYTWRTIKELINRKFGRTPTVIVVS